MKTLKATVQGPQNMTVIPCYFSSLTQLLFFNYTEQILEVTFIMIINVNRYKNLVLAPNVAQQ